MNDERFAIDERRLIAAVAQVLEILATRLDAGEPVPNALLGDAVAGLRAFTGDKYEPRGHAFATVAGEAQRTAAQILVDEMEIALEALERGEAGASGAFVIQARAGIRLLREHTDVEPAPRRSPNDDGESMGLSDATRKSAPSSTLRHFKRLLKNYAKWTGAAPRT